MKEKGIASEVVAVSIGPKACAETLRSALAMGADTGVHVETDLRPDQDLQPLAVSRVFAELAKRFQPRIILLGKQVRAHTTQGTGCMAHGGRRDCNAIDCDCGWPSERLPD
jgi:electron transfer flavoprotein beta subunit